MTVVMTMVRNMPCKCKASKPYMTYRGLELTSVFLIVWRVLPNIWNVLVGGLRSTKLAWYCIFL